MVVPDHLEDDRAQVLRFPRTDPVDVQQFRRCRWSSPRQVAQRVVVEDDIGRHAPDLRHLGTALSQGFEQPSVHTIPGGGVARYPACAPSWGRTRLSIELDGRQALERRHAVVSQLEHRIRSVGAQQQLLLGQLVEIPTQLGDRDVGEQAEGAQLLVPPGGDLVGDTTA